jgi:hypothetical protein
MSAADSDFLIESLRKLQQKNALRSEYITDPSIPEQKKKAVSDVLKKEKEANLAKAGDTHVSVENGKPVYNSGAIDVSGVLPEEVAPVRPPVIEEAPLEAPLEKEKPSIRDLMPKGPMREGVVNQNAGKTITPPVYDKSFPWERALIGATPLLVGLLTGNRLEGVKTSSDYFVNSESDLYKRERDLQNKLAEMQAKQDMARSPAESGKKRFSSSTIALEDGQNIKAVFDTFTGKYFYPDGSEIASDLIRAGYAVNPEEFDRRKGVSSNYKRSDADYLSQGARVDPTTGELGIVRNGEINPIKGQATGQLNKKQEADIKDAVKEFTKSAAYQDSTQALTLAPQVNSLLDAVQRSNDPNAIAGNSVVLTMIRQAQRVGVASDRDAAAMGGTQQWEESINRITEKLLGSGKPLTNRDIQDLREISNIYTKRAKDMLGAFYNEKKGSYASRYNISPEIIDQHIGADVRPYMNLAEKKIEANNAPKKLVHGGKTWTSPSREESIPFTLGNDGTVYWTKPDLWDAVKKQEPKAKRLER